MHIFVANPRPENYERRRRWMIWTIYTVAFMIGSENAVIYPTVWRYLQELGIQDENVLGYVISAFSVGALVSGVSLGILADKWERSRSIVLWFNLCSVVGNFMYLLGGSKWMLIAGRFVAGIGGGIGSVILAELAKATRVSERARVMAVSFGARQLGLAFGPVYNLIMGQTSFSFFGLVDVSETNFAGFFMVVVWVAFEFIFFAAYFDAGIEMKSILDAETCRRFRKSYRSINRADSVEDGKTGFGEKATVSERPLAERSASEGEEVVPDERGPLLDAGVEPVRRQTSHEAFSRQGDEKHLESVWTTNSFQESLSLIQKYFNYFLTDTVITLLFVQFLAFFIQNVLETTIPPANQYYFGFGPRENSFVYLAIGLEAIAIYVVFYFLLRCVSERVMLAGSCAMMVVGCTFALAVSSQLEEGNPKLFPMYMAGCTVMFLAVPLASITTMTIFSKALPREVQGFAQGIRRVCNYIGLILGPMYGSGLAYEGLVLYTLPLAMSVVALVLVMASYSKYKLFLER